MIQVNKLIEACPCHVCRSDLAYVHPCAVVTAPRPRPQPVRKQK